MTARACEASDELTLASGELVHLSLLVERATATLVAATTSLHEHRVTADAYRKACDELAAFAAADPGVLRDRTAPLAARILRSGRLERVVARWRDDAASTGRPVSVAASRAAASLPAMADGTAAIADATALRACWLDLVDGLRDVAARAEADAAATHQAQARAIASTVASTAAAAVAAVRVERALAAVGVPAAAAEPLTAAGRRARAGAEQMLRDHGFEPPGGADPECSPRVWEASSAHACAGWLLDTARSVATSAGRPAPFDRDRMPSRIIERLCGHVAGVER